jgi:hypothetical protein
MDKVHRINRRAAVLGSVACAAAIAVPAVAADQSTSIEALAERFRDDAMALDPRITECWVGYDEVVDGPRDMRVMHVYFGRKDTPFLSPVQPRRENITDLFEQWRSERSDRAGETDAQAAARFDRYAELQRKITGMRPRSAREVAMQLVVETDDGDSDYRPEFFRQLRLIAMGM